MPKRINSRGDFLKYSIVSGSYPRVHMDKPNFTDVSEKKTEDAARPIAYPQGLHIGYKADSYVRLPLQLIAQLRGPGRRNLLPRAVCLAVLAEQLGPEQREAKLPKQKLLQELGCSEATLKRILDELCQGGHLEKWTVGGKRKAGDSVRWYALPGPGDQRVCRGEWYPGGYFIKLFKALLDLPKISLAAVSVYGRLLGRSTDGDSVQLSVESLSTDLELGEKGVRTAQKQLVELGLIEVVRRGGMASAHTWGLLDLEVWLRRCTNWVEVVAAAGLNEPNGRQPVVRKDQLERKKGSIRPSDKLNKDDGKGQQDACYSRSVKPSEKNRGEGAAAASPPAHTPNSFESDNSEHQDRDYSVPTEPAVHPCSQPAESLMEGEQVHQPRPSEGEDSKTDLQSAGDRDSTAGEPVPGGLVLHQIDDRHFELTIPDLMGQVSQSEIIDYWVAHGELMAPLGKAFFRDAPPHMVYLYGPPGCGKTALMNAWQAIADGLNQPVQHYAIVDKSFATQLSDGTFASRVYAPGRTLSIEHALDYVRARSMTATLKSLGCDSPGARIYQLTGETMGAMLVDYIVRLRGFVIIDDLFEEHIDFSLLKALAGIVNQRFEAGAHTAIISNIDPDDLGKDEARKKPKYVPGQKTLIRRMLGGTIVQVTSPPLDPYGRSQAAKSKS